MRLRFPCPAPTFLPAPLKTETPHRPEIDALRALAVLAVFIFHLDHRWLPGGFVGVDVFFVISGYLIASGIRRQQQANQFSFLKFYQRRIARLLPAFLATACATLLAARSLYSAQDYASAGASFSAALLSFANHQLLQQGDYFALSPDAQPLLHCWTLSLEEQFYLLFPLCFWLLLRRAPNWPFLGLALLTAASFACGLVLTATHPTAAFYLLPARAWELLVGGLLALAHTSSTARAHSPPRPFRALCGRLPLAPLGLLLLLGSFALIQESQPFPGALALLPVLGALAVLHSLSAAPPGLAGAALAPRCLTGALLLPPLAALGRLSDSLYLWHWPIFSFVDYSLLLSSPALRLALKIFLSAAAALASYHLIEKPGRALLNRPQSLPLAYALLALSLAALVPLGHSIRESHYLDASARGEIIFPQPAPRGSLVLMGDSQASTFAPALRDLAQDLNLRCVILSAAGGDPLAPSSGPPSALWQANFAAIQRERPTFLVLACAWTYKLTGDPARLQKTLDALQPHVGQILLLTQPPQPPPSAERAALRQGARPPFLESPSDRSLRQAVNDIVRQAAAPRRTVLDLDPLFTSANGDLPVFSPQGRLLYQDHLHLSDAGTERVLPLLRQALSQSP